MIKLLITILSKYQIREVSVFPTLIYISLLYIPSANASFNYLINKIKRC